MFNDLEAEEKKLHYSHSEHYVPHVSRIPHVIEVANADYALALSTGSQLSPTSLRSLQLYLILLVPCMCSFSYGFDGSVIGAVSKMKQYLDYFHIDAADAAGGIGTVTVLIYGMHTIGSVAGVAIAGPMADRFGRRGGMFVGSVIIMAGSLIGTFARNTHYLLGGRFVLGFGVTIATTAAPIYVVEMSPPQWRGRLTGLYNTFYLFGTILCMLITNATGGLSSSTSWRVPLAIQIAPAGIIAILVYFLPESPRWLLSVSRRVEARHILTKYHGNEDGNAPLVLLEWKEFEEAVKLNGSDKRWWDYSGLFGTHSARNRTNLAALIGFFGQRSSNIAGYFLPILFRNIGATAQEIKHIDFASIIIATGGALVGSAFADKVGRRTIWLWGMIICAGLFAITTGCVAKWGVDGADSQGSKIAISFFLILGFASTLTYTPLQVLLPAECYNYNTRAKGMAFYILSGIMGSLPDTYGSPIFLPKLKWKYFAIFAGIYLGNCGIIWAFAVETKGRTLEELNEIFEDPRPVKASLVKQKVQEKADGTVIVNFDSVRV